MSLSMLCGCFCCFFFVKQKTAYEMRISDWSSDVCSSDLLRGMGETATDRNRRRGLTRRATLLRAAALYEEAHADADGRVPASFDILYLTGWAPHAPQPQALRPGSAAARLADRSEERRGGQGGVRSCDTGWSAEPSKKKKKKK